MPVMNAAERKFAEAIADLTYCNPFLPHRIELERAALGTAFVEQNAEWNMRPEAMEEHPNVAALRDRSVALMGRVREKFLAGQKPTDPEVPLYEDLVVFALYHRYREGFDRAILAPDNRKGRVTLYDSFEEEAQKYVALPGLERIVWPDLAHAFACVYQVRRAFHHIFSHVIGVSKPMIRLRAAVWQSIFTHDMRRFRRTLYNRMSDFTTLIQGPSGTGKEVVARAVGLSRYIPFDARTRNFTEDFAGSFAAINHSAMSPTLIESELFGHKRGAFTGATEDKKGLFEIADGGTLFLDEITETPLSLQSKLLRALQEGEIRPVGGKAARKVDVRVIAATNRKLPELVKKGTFRSDLYFRLAVAKLTIPALRDRPDDIIPTATSLLRSRVGDPNAFLPAPKLLENETCRISGSVPPQGAMKSGICLTLALLAKSGVTLNPIL